jgi:hypothetical protein
MEDKLADKAAILNQYKNYDLGNQHEQDPGTAALVRDQEAELRRQQRENGIAPESQQTDGNAFRVRF